MQKLSPREQQVLALYLKEGRLQPVADALDLSINTVRNQRTSLMKKLGARTSVELTLSAIKKGLVEP